MSHVKVLAVLLGGSLLLGALSTPAWAMTKACKRDIHKAERRLKRAERRFGQNSKQAEGRRKELDNVRARCSDYDTQKNQRR